MSNNQYLRKVSHDEEMSNKVNDTIS